MAAGIFNQFAMLKFKAKIEIIGVNPFVFLPDKVLQALFKQAGKSKGKIPVMMKIEGQKFTQTLVKYSGAWRLYLNLPMRKAAQKDVGEEAKFEIAFDAKQRTVLMHAQLQQALDENVQAKRAFESLSPSRQLEINRYLNALKTEATVERNVRRAIQFLLGNERFVGRDFL